MKNLCADSEDTPECSRHVSDDEGNGDEGDGDSDQDDSDAEDKDNADDDVIEEAWALASEHLS